MFARSSRPAARSRPAPAPAPRKPAPAIVKAGARGSRPQAANSPKRSQAVKGAVKGAAIGAISSVPIVGGAIAGAITGYTAKGEPIYKKKRKHGLINKRARKTISKAYRYYKQLKKAERQIEKMAGKSGVRRHFNRPNYFRKGKRY